MDYSGISSYIRSLPERPTLNRETEANLARKSKNGGKDGERAKMAIVETNLRLVISIAKDHQYMGVDLEDLIAEGNLGLLKAVEKFDPELGCRLSTYASWWIRESIKAAITKQSRTVRVPKKTLLKIAKVKKILHKLSQELGREPSLEELAGETQIAVNKLEEILRWDTRTVSADSKKTPDGNNLVETIVDENTHAPSEKTLKISDGEWTEGLLCCLTEQERDIIESRFGWKNEPQTLKQIGDRLGLTRERVRQIEFRILKKLRRRANQLSQEENP